MYCRNAPPDVRTRVKFGTAVTNFLAGNLSARGWTEMSLSSERVPLDSSTLVAAAYDYHRGQLQLDFHDATHYIYFSVPSAIFAELIQAHSAGTFFNRYIRGHFPYAKRQP